jgi:hypothetical protein
MSGANESGPAVTGPESEKSMTVKHKVGRFWANVKDWWTANVRHGVRVEVQELPRNQVCDVCHHYIPQEQLFILDSVPYHRECLWESRGVNPHAKDPKDVLPDLSVKRYEPDARDRFYTAPTGAQLN